jgi:hypothetical protein
MAQLKQVNTVAQMVPRETQMKVAQHYVPALKAVNTSNGDLRNKSQGTNQSQGVNQSQGTNQGLQRTGQYSAPPPPPSGPSLLSNGPPPALRMPQIKPNQFNQATPSQAFKALSISSQPPSFQSKPNSQQSTQPTYQSSNLPANVVRDGRFEFRTDIPPPRTAKRNMIPTSTRQEQQNRTASPRLPPPPPPPSQR